jgi:hypothetical protein
MSTRFVLLTPACYLLTVMLEETNGPPTKLAYNERTCILQR